MTDDVHQSFLARAVAAAVDSVRQGGGPFGALVVRGDRVVATGVNRVTAELDPTAHAEVVAIRRACRALSDFALRGCTLYTSCEPCPLCLSAAYWARLDAVYYAACREDAAAAGFDDARLYAELGKAPSERELPLRRITGPEVLAPFEAWRAAVGRVEY